MNVVILYGGNSGEHEISLVSASSVVRNISEKHTVHLISITKSGAWYAEENSELERVKNNPDATLKIHAEEKNRVSVIPGGGKDGAFVADKKFIKADVVLPILHGTYGEDGTIQGLLEIANVPYMGCGVFASAATMDKAETKILLEHAGIPVVPSICITRADINDRTSYDKKVQQAIQDLKFPLFVKPCSAGSSDGASKAANERELSYALMEAFQWDNKVLIEKAIDAREVECSVIGNSVTTDASVPHTVIEAYGPGEIIPKHTFYDYDAKYNDPDGALLKIPADISKEQTEQIRAMAVKAFRVVNASGLSRVDFFIDKNDKKIYLNEINSIPGFTSISMFAKLCAAEGLDFTALLEKLILQALSAFKARTSLRTSRT